MSNKDYAKLSLEMHKKLHGKLEVVAKCPLETVDDLSIAYTPGVAQSCVEIAQNLELAYDYTIKGRTIAVVTDGSAVLGLGNIGATAALPVMEGKAALFKCFANIDAVPVCLDTQDVDEIVRTVRLIAPGFGGINLEDISAPRCFEVEKRLDEELDIPVFHDDQHGTAVVVGAALLNVCKLLLRKVEDLHIVINGAGAAGTSITNMLISLGARNITVVDSRGVVNSARVDLTQQKFELAQTLERLNSVRSNATTLRQALVNADVFIGVSAPKVVDEDTVRSMNTDAVIFALSNPVPEIMPEVALSAGAKITATGRSDFHNQINNVLAFPGIFKGALESRASSITQNMLIAATNALADFVPSGELSTTRIIPQAFDQGVADVVAEAVSGAWIKDQELGSA
ncbi:MAG: NADP-dependent malic enzyme [Candidatus Ancillula trichonymphae]|jgi:malate dehydrogenase (oxaloacetate-decarboxylating)|nr:NADP-dependent malic enzyme [Candidatus Ancillula trichonymphae]